MARAEPATRSKRNSRHSIGPFQSGTRRDVENAFLKRTMIEDIKSITGKDLVIEKSGDGIVISDEYTNCVHVVANLRACMDFAPSYKK